MNSIIDFFEGVQILLELACIGVFLSKLKYVREYGLSLWGVYLILDLTFALIASVITIFLLPTLSSLTVMNLFLNILMIFQIGFVLLLVKRFEVVKSNILAIVFGVFIIIWSIEFYIKGINGNAILYTTSIFSKMVIFCLSCFYLFGVFKKMPANYRDTPFLFVIIGWLLYSTTFIIFENPELTKLVEAVWVKEVLLIATAITQSVALIFTMIAFWKTKRWVQTYQQ